MKKGLTEIVMVLDRSGSMSSTREDAEGGMREFIAKQKLVPGQCDVTFYRFDNEIERVFDKKPIENVSNELLKLEPRGMTALLDAMAKAIDEVGERLRNTPEDQRPEKVFFVTITDGCENASRENNKYAVQERVTRQRDRYQWEFHFIGATLDAIATATAVSIMPQYTLAYNASKIGTQNSYASLANNVATTRATGVSMSYSAEDRTKAMEQ